MIQSRCGFCASAVNESVESRTPFLLPLWEYAPLCNRLKELRKSKRCPYGVPPANPISRRVFIAGRCIPLDGWNRAPRTSALRQRASLALDHVYDPHWSRSDEVGRDRRSRMATIGPAGLRQLSAKMVGLTTMPTPSGGRPWQQTRRQLVDGGLELERLDRKTQ